MIGLYLFALIFGFGVILVDLLGLLGSDDDSDGDDWNESSDVNADEGVEHGNLDADDDAVVLPDLRRGRWVYRMLNILRGVVYFSVGFGAVGVFGTFTERGILNTLIWSIGTGVVVLAAVKLVMRLQNRVLDSQIHAGELLFAEAEVLVSIPPGKLGRIRIKSGGSYHDMYAKGYDENRSYSMGEQVFVVDVSGPDPVVHWEKL